MLISTIRASLDTEQFTMNKLFIFAVLLLVTHNSMADALQSASKNIQEQLTKVRSNVSVVNIKASNVTGMYEVVLSSGQTLHFTADGKYFFTGDLYEIGPTQLVNVSESARAAVRKALLAQLDENEMVIFSPPKDRVKATVTVFTDIDCVYCRKLHQEVLDLNRLGVAVRYLAYPRAGIGSTSYDKLVSVWCANNPRIALTKAKLGEEIEAATCGNPVAAQHQLASQMSINSTPALIFEDGTLAPGYLPAEKLAAALGIL